MLGRSRDAGYVCYDSEDLAFHEMTIAETKEWVKSYGVNGLVLNEAGELALDADNYITTNMMTKSGVGRYRLLIPDRNLYDEDTLFYVTKCIYDGDKTAYEVVSSKCARLIFEKESVVRLYSEAILNGIIMLADDNGEKDEIVLCSGVEFIDLEKLRKEYADYADSLCSAGSSFFDSTGAGEGNDTVDGDSMALGASVEFDDISDWVKDEATEAIVVDEIDTIAAEEDALETKEKKHAAKKKNTKTGTVKNNATTRKNKSSKAGTK